MKRVGALLVIACMTTIVLLLASCGQATGPTGAKTTASTKDTGTAKVTLKKLDGTTVEKSIEKPKYGGELTYVPPGGTQNFGFDEAFCSGAADLTLHLTNEKLLSGNWALGPSGTGDASFLFPGYPGAEVMEGRIAESWELKEPGTLVFHIRKGIHWDNVPPANGRELTAEDVVFSINRDYKIPTAYLLQTAPDKQVPQVTATDNWTVVLKCAPKYQWIFFEDVGAKCNIMCPDMMKQYPDFRDWKASCGTGPFMVKDYSEGSFVRMVKNPDYWRKDPLNPENKLPYLDTVTQVFVEDASTRVASMRAGKLDVLRDLSNEEYTDLIKTNPDLKYVKAPVQTSPVISMRTDKSPFNDIKVRRALQMGLDLQTIKAKFYGGEALVPGFPSVTWAEFADMYTPIEQLPASVKELYTYNPDKAKQLLAEAGYPSGFKTSVACIAKDADLLAVVKDQWSKIGVDLSLDVKETAVMNSLANAHKHEQMVRRDQGNSMPFKMYSYRTDVQQNYSIVVDDYANKIYDDLCNHYTDRAYTHKLYKDFTLYALDKAWYIDMGCPILYHMYQPWVKGYSGEWSPGYQQKNAYPMYVWVDQDLKKKMGK